MDWTLEKIRSKVRKLTGKLSTNQLTEANLDVYINHFYQNQLPTQLRASELQTWWTQNTVAGIDEYTLDSDYLSIMPPFTIAGLEYPLRMNPAEFYAAWPETQSYDQDEPYDVLYYARTITLRPPPDDVYLLKAAAIVRPDSLAAAGSIPLNGSWGPLIAYGSAIDIVLEDGDMQLAAELSEGYNALLSMALMPNLLQLNTQRSVPRF